MKVFKFILKVLLLITILGTIIFLYSKYLNSTGFIVKERTLYNKQLPNEFDGLKVVQICDINYKTTVKNKELQSIVQKINLTKPDIVLLTGDLLNSEVEYSSKDIENITKQLSLIDTTIDKYAISGEQDLKKNEWEQIINDSGFINLNDKYQLIYKNEDHILIGGLSSINNKEKTSNKINTTIDYLNSNNVYSILIMHEPDEIKNIDYDKFNLVLAGHSLGGQFKLPFIGGLLTKKGSKKYINDSYQIHQTKLYVSNGLGNESIKYRFLNKPSFNLFRLRTKTN